VQIQESTINPLIPLPRIPRYLEIKGEKGFGLDIKGKRKAIVEISFKVST